MNVFFLRFRHKDKLKEKRQRIEVAEVYGFYRFVQQV